MKKLIVLLLTIAMVGAVFAEEAPAPVLKWSGLLNTGFQYDNSTDSLYLYGQNAGKASRLRLNADYTNGDFGVHFRLQTDDATTTAFSIKHALVWGNLFNNMATFKVGLLNDSTWATPYNSFGSLDGKKGVQLQVKPIKGLNVGAFMPLMPLDTTKTVPAGDVPKDMTFAGKYSISGIADVLAGLNLGVAPTTKTEAYGSVNVTAIENLTAIVEADLTDISDIANTLSLDEYASYAMGNLAVGAYLEQDFGSTFGWTIAPEVSYAIDKAEVGGSFTIASGSVWSIDPYVTYTLNDKSTVKGYASYDNASVFTFGVSLLFNF
jgi:hypothetical protein